jgi:hypothetical protein
MSPLMEEQKKVSHVLHLLLSIISCGFWVPVWMLICLSVSLENRGIRKRNEKRYIKERDQLMYSHLQMMNKR